MIKSQREMMSYLSKNFREDFNPKLFERNTNDIIEDLKKVILSICVKTPYFSIDVLSFEIIDDYDKIKEILYNYGEVYKNRNKNKTKDNIYDYIDIDPSEFIILMVNYRIEAGNESSNLSVPIAVPCIVDKYYFNIQGNLYIPQIQVVDASTYNNRLSKSKYQSVVLKTLSPPIRMYKHNTKLITTTNELVNTTYFDLNAFKKTSRSFKYILAKYGFNGAMQFLGLEGIYLYDDNHIPTPNDNYYVFYNKDNITMKSYSSKVGVYIQVSKYLFDNDTVTQNMIISIIDSTVWLTSFNDLFTDIFWKRALGADFKSDTVDKGISILISFEGILDIITKETIHLPDNLKENMYGILKWMVCEFSSLRDKDNLNILTKRIRISEYIAAIYASKLNTGIYRIPDTGQHVTINTIKKSINIDPMYLIKEIAKCNLITFNNIVTDCDATEVLKFSVKGQSGLGNNNSKSIPWIYRYNNESYLGVLDLDATSASDPGVTGIICPTAKLYNNSFSEFEEPNTWPAMYAKLLDEYHRVTGIKQAIIINNDVTGNDNSEQLSTVNAVLQMTENNRRLISSVMDKNSDNGLVCPFVVLNGNNNISINIPVIEEDD